MGFIPIDLCRVANIGKAGAENERFPVEVVEAAVKDFFSDEDVRCRPRHVTILLSCGCGGKRFLLAEFRAFPFHICPFFHPFRPKEVESRQGDLGSD